jgi:hypothetical protein
VDRVADIAELGTGCARRQATGEGVHAIAVLVGDLVTLKPPPLI